VSSGEVVRATVASGAGRGLDGAKLLLVRPRPPRQSERAPDSSRSTRSTPDRRSRARRRGSLVARRDGFGVRSPTRTSSSPSRRSVGGCGVSRRVVGSVWRRARTARLVGAKLLRRAAARRPRRRCSRRPPRRRRRGRRGLATRQSAASGGPRAWPGAMATSADGDKPSTRRFWGSSTRRGRRGRGAGAGRGSGHAAGRCPPLEARVIRGTSVGRSGPRGACRAWAGASSALRRARRRRAPERPLVVATGHLARAPATTSRRLRLGRAQHF